MTLANPDKKLGTFMKKMTTTIAVLENKFAEYGVKTSCYFDRLSIYLDAHSREDNLEKLLDDNKENKFLWQPLPHNDFFDRKVELFQPSAQCLAELTDTDVVGGDCAINYVEFALDFITGSQCTLNKLDRFFNRHLVRIPSKRSKATPYHNDDYAKTAYLSAKVDKERLLFYSDKPARKAQGQLCLHVEFRLAGWTLLKKKNILILRDLINFDHQQLWGTQLDLRKPNFTQLGIACRNGGG